MDNEEVDPAAYVRLVDRMAEEIRESLPESADESARLAALNNSLFAEHGFHGSRGEYYHKSNSYVNEVLDDREGLPITLSVIYMELARRLDLEVVGIALPGHFVTQFRPMEGSPRLIDVFNQAKVLSRADAYELVLGNTGNPLTEEQLKPATRQSILVRMLHNLMGLSQRSRDLEGMGRYLDTIVAIAPDSGEERWMRAVVRYQLRRPDDSRADVDWLLEHKPEGVDLNRVLELQQVLDRLE
jgi:regulator of sirC expression with transglutaminase-like and TPR domain